MSIYIYIYNIYKKMLTLQERIEILLSKSEVMVLLCSKASGYWSMIKFALNIPLVLTSSTMCVINSISEDVNGVKVPNIVVNTISVLTISLNNSIKSSEKCDLFRRLSQQFLLLTGQIENDNEITDSEFQLISLKYENLINDVLFEETPTRYKLQIAESFKNRVVQLQLNETIGNNIKVEMVKLV
jgi:hypothetical protein